MDEKTLLNKLYQECGLDKSDIFKHKHFTIITRSGIEKIQYKMNIQVHFDPVVINQEIAVIKATGVKDASFSTKKMIETFGEWNMTHAKRDKDGNVVPYYHVAMAEKRALSRVVLKLANLYEHDVLGEDETVYEMPASPEQIDTIEALLRTSVYDETQKTRIEKEMGDYSQQDASVCIHVLKENQRDPIASGDNYNQSDIKEKI